MLKWLTVAALVLLVLTGAMGLRNLVVARASTMSASNSFNPAIWSNGPGPIPRFHGGPGSGNGPGPIPRFRGGHGTANGPGPIPRFHGGDH